jgi:uncharacterized membrane protein YdjX (TVP38/TMEM64 family)
MPYIFATLAGLLPGTAAVVILGNAFAGDSNPLMILVSLSTAALGLCGLAYEVRQYRQQHRDAPEAAEVIAPVTARVAEPAVTH